MTRYSEIEKKFKQRAISLFKEHRETLRRIYRMDAETSREEKERHYMQETYPKYDREWAGLAGSFISETVLLQNELEERVFGKLSSEHLVSLASVPTDRLEEVLSTASAAGDKKLQESIVAVAQRRGERGLVNKWIGGDPARKAALEELRSIPEPERLEAIAKSVRHPKASSEALAPDEQAISRQADKAASDAAARAAFFNRPRSISGRHTRVW